MTCWGTPGGAERGRRGMERSLDSAEQHDTGDVAGTWYAFIASPCRSNALVRCVRSLTPYESKGCLHVQVHAPDGARVEASREIDACEAVEEREANAGAPNVA